MISFNYRISRGFDLLIFELIIIEIINQTHVCWRELIPSQKKNIRELSDICMSQYVIISTGTLFVIYTSRVCCSVNFGLMYDYMHFVEKSG